MHFSMSSLSLIFYSWSKVSIANSLLIIPEYGYLSLIFTFYFTSLWVLRGIEFIYTRMCLYNL